VWRKARTGGAAAARAFAVSALIATCVVSPFTYDREMADRTILGARPTYGPLTVSAVPNQAALGRLLWVPGIDDGWDPQGLAFAEGDLLVSAYRSDRSGVNRGPCRVFRVDPSTGGETGHFDVPAPCGHAGGLAYGGRGRLYIIDTHTLFEVNLGAAFGTTTPAFRILPLGPGLIGALAASGDGEIWIGTYEQGRPGRIFKYDAAFLETLADGSLLTEAMAVAKLRIPSYAQGAAADPGGDKLWISRSEIAWGSLDRIDAVSGGGEARYSAAGGIEGITFDQAGRLWGVSEAGARHLPLRYPFFPLIFALDTARLEPALVH
jgi:hypothetical protein